MPHPQHRVWRSVNPQCPSFPGKTGLRRSQEVTNSSPYPSRENNKCPWLFPHLQHYPNTLVITQATW